MVVMLMVSAIGMFTCRSFISIVISLCLLLMLSFVSSCARVTEFTTVYWLPRFRRCWKTLLSLLAALYEGAYFTDYWSDRVAVFVKFYLCLKCGSVWVSYC